MAWWGGAVGKLAWLLLSRPPPAWAARVFLAGWDAPASLVAELRSAVADVTRDVLAGRLRSALATDTTDALAGCPVPLLHLGGSRDRIIRHAVVSEMRRVQPSMQHLLLDSPHLVLQRQPVASAKAIHGFLRDLGKSSVP